MSAVETMPVPAATFTLRHYYLQLTLIPSHFLTAPLCEGNETKRNTGATHLVNKSFSDKCTNQPLTSLRCSNDLALYRQDNI